MIDFFARRSTLTNSLFLVLVLVGLFLYNSMPLESYPKMEVGRMDINTFWPGASPEETEKLITAKVEETLADLEHIIWVKSISQYGRSRIYLKFDENLEEEDYNRLYLDVESEIRKIDDLPQEAEAPQITRINTKLIRPTLVIALAGDIPEKARIDIAKELKEILQRIPEVTTVSMRGERNREVKIDVDREKAEQYGLSLLDVVNLIRQENSTSPGGSLQIEGSEISVYTSAELKTIEELRSLIVVSDGTGNVIRLGEIAQISWGYEKWQIMARARGSTAIFLTCVKEDKSNALKVVPKVKQIVREFQQKLPKEVDISFFQDEVVYINRTLSILKSNLLMGLVLVGIGLWMSIGFKNAFLAVMGIPFCFLCSLIFFHWSGTSINEIVLVSLVIVSGMVVDDTIIITENIHRHYQDGLSLVEAASVGAKEVLWPVLAASATTIVSFSPILLMDGITGKFMAILPKSISFILAASLFEAFLIMPSHYVDLTHLSPFKSRKSREYRSILRDIYMKILPWFMRFRYISALFFIIVIPVGLFMLLDTRSVPVVLYPYDFHEFRIKVRLDQNSSLEHTAEKIKEVEDVIDQLQTDEIENYTVNIGRYLTDDIVSFHPSYAQFTITLNSARKSKRTPNEIIADIDRLLKNANLKGFQMLEVAIIPNSPITEKPVTIRIRGENLTILNDISNLIKDKLESIEGVREIHDDIPAERYGITVYFKEDQIKRYQLTRRQVGQTISAAIEGIEASEIYGSEEQYKIRVKYTSQNLSLIDDLNQIKIKTPSGVQIRLDDVADFSYGYTTSQINHYNRKRSATITAEVDLEKTNSTDVNLEMQRFLESHRDKYPGYLFEFAGEFQETQGVFADLNFAFLIALISIYLILSTQFNSVLQPFIVMSIIPFALIGVTYGLWFFQMPFTMLTFIAIIGLSGVVVNDSLVLIDFINREAQNKTPYDAVYEGCRKRFRPILLTTITTVLGLLPLALGWGGKSTTWGPMATAFSWGLIFSTVLTLLFVPILYLILEDVVAKTKQLLGYKSA